VGSAVDATLISAPSSTKKAGTRDPEMSQTQKGGSWYFGMKAHVRPESRLNFCLTQRGVHVVIKPVVPSTVPYPDMRSR
jgi:IS5 family transposase